jgi:radical SAM superfamily enzyme YgiQ (UPF0313 family)
MQTVCFVTPPSAFLLDERVFPALGILKVAAAVEQAGYPVEHLDLAGVANYEAVVMAHCHATEARTFALTATSPQMPAATRVAATIRKELPNAKIILGGPHATLVNAAAKLELRRGCRGRAVSSLSALQESFHVIVSGDGERAIFSAIDGVAGSNFDADVIDADNPASPLWLTSQGFSESPWPARHLIDMQSYHYSIDGEPAMHMVCQLGCPFACGFCGGRNSPMLRRVRLRSTESAIEEMEHLHRAYGVKAMMLNDDELNVNRQMIPLMHAIRDLGRRYGFEWKLRGFVKAELFDDEQAKAMHDAGFRWLLCGFESAHPRILRNINKKATLEENTKMLRVAHANGLNVKALMSFGHPGESEETILATRDWLLSERPDDFDCTVITEYPGTPYWDESVPISDGEYVYETNGDKLYSRDINFTKDAAFYKGRVGSYRSFVWTDFISPDRLVELRDAVEDEVRTKLGIPYPVEPSAINFEHSMGSGPLPSQILRSIHAG